MKEVKKHLASALRQFRHNNIDEFVMGFDVEETEKILLNLLNPPVTINVPEDIKTKVDYTSEEFWKDAPRGYKFALVNDEAEIVEFFERKPSTSNCEECFMVDVSETLYLKGPWVLMEKLDITKQSPVFTNQMRDNDILPDIGVNCLLSKSRNSGNGNCGFVAGENGGQEVYITAHFESRSGTKMAAYLSADQYEVFGGVACALAFEELPKSVNLIDGKPYSFKTPLFGNGVGYYDLSTKCFINLNHSVRAESCTNTQLLTNSRG